MTLLCEEAGDRAISAMPMMLRDVAVANLIVAFILNIDAAIKHETWAKKN